MNDTPYFKVLDDLIKEAEEIAGSWNGDESGRQEEQAESAKEIIEKCQEIKELINYINE
jgi:hypothetical protein